MKHFDINIYSIFLHIFI